MMADNQFGRDAVSRRKFIAAAGITGTVAAAGCLGSTGESSGSGPLTADGSSTVYPITSDAASYWNSNHPADDGEYWGSNDEGTASGYDQIDNPDNKNLADYWAGLYGFEAKDSAAPPFSVNVGLSHSGTGIEKVANEQVDIGDASSSVADELPDASQEELDKYTDHVVARDGQPVVVSREIWDAGVEKLTGDQVRGIYTGEITNWSEISSYNGPDKEIQAVGRAVGSGTDTAFRANMLGDPEADMSVDIRKGQNQQVQTTVADSDNAIAYMALAFVDMDRVPAISLELDGTTYTLGENLGSKDYPLSRELHCYTYEGTSEKEAAFINMLLSEFGQRHFVQPNNYFMLPPEEREEQRSKLPEQSN
ncbi:phosphate ABC transporter substrate-binding protein, phot family [Natrinema sp. J7-2]|nr:phosphate ABC transporter substrate-binding protein, phot family [Natrinema sp. J7-2]